MDLCRNTMGMYIGQYLRILWNLAVFQSFDGAGLSLINGGIYDLVIPIVDYLVLIENDDVEVIEGRKKNRKEAKSMQDFVE